MMELEEFANPKHMTNEMGEAVQRQMRRAQVSAIINRRGWTQKQWIEDADRLMDELDGAITSLVNGHVLALLDFWREAVKREDRSKTNPATEKAVEVMRTNLDAVKREDR